MSTSERAQAIAINAVGKDPSSAPDVAQLLAAEAVRLIVEGEAPDRSALARALFARHPTAGISAANHIAVSALE